jgi:hypothetical protein
MGDSARRLTPLPPFQSLARHQAASQLRNCRWRTGVYNMALENLQMKTLTFTEFRKNASRILDLVEKGESIRVLRHDKAIAKIVPVDLPEPTPARKRPGLPAPR